MGWFIFILIVGALAYGWFYLSKKQQVPGKTETSSPLPLAEPESNAIMKKLEEIDRKVGKLAMAMEAREAREKAAREMAEEEPKEE